jgi:hypothetical protein
MLGQAPAMFSKCTRPIPASRSALPFQACRLAHTAATSAGAPLHHCSRSGNSRLARYTSSSKTMRFSIAVQLGAALQALQGKTAAHAQRLFGTACSGEKPASG